MNERIIVPAIQKMDLIFDLLLSESGGLTQTEICNRLNLPKATVFRIIKILEELCYIDFDQNSSRYTLGVKLLTLGNIVNKRLSLLETASPIVRKISENLNEMVKVSIIRSNIIYPIFTCESKKAIRITLDYGTVFPPYVGAAGKLLLAMTKDGEKYIKNILPNIQLEKLTDNTITDKDKLLAILDKIRIKKIAYDNQEESEGIYAISAPIYDLESNVIAALSIPFFGDREEKSKRYMKHLLKGAEDISRLIGYAN